MFSILTKNRLIVFCKSFFLLLLLIMRSLYSQFRIRSFLPSASLSFFHYVTRPRSRCRRRLLPPFFFSFRQNCFFGGRNSEARTRITGTPTTQSLPHGWLWHVDSYSYRFMHIARMQIARSQIVWKFSRKSQEMTEEMFDMCEQKTRERFHIDITPP